jgi:hypothetical protein
MNPTSYRLKIKSPNATTYQYFETMAQVVLFCIDAYAMADSIGLKLDIELETGCFDSRGYEVGMN